jgi:hypothetical protein
MGGTLLKNHFRTAVLIAAAVLVIMSAAVFAQDLDAADPNVEELIQLLDDVSRVMNTLVQNGFTIEHLELDSMGLDEKYRSSYPFYGGLEYAVVGIGGPAISDLDVYIFDDEAELFISDADDNPIAVVTFTVEESVLYHSVFHTYSLAAGYSEDSPYYFAFIIAAR